MVKDETKLITGCSDSELRVWQITCKPQGEDEEPGMKRKPDTEDSGSNTSDKVKNSTE